MLQLPNEEFFSDTYLDAFYRAHVASRTRGNLDEDIAAIEAEIKKVKCYQSKFRSYRHLNSCGNSECSDEDDLDQPVNSSPTSVFKVYNSSMGKAAVFPSGDISPFFFHRGPDIFTWAVTQQIAHDHSYCKASDAPQESLIDHGTITMKNIQWHLLATAKRAQAVHKLSCILQHRPSGRHSPTFSSLDLLPSSLANCIRKTGSLGLNGSVKKSSSHVDSNKTTPSSSAAASMAGSNNSRSKKNLPPSSGGGVLQSAELAVPPPSAPPCQSSNNASQVIGIKEIKSKQRAPVTPPNSASKDAAGGPTTRSSSRKRTRPSPYDRPNKSTRTTRSMEVTRVRNISSCSEDGEDPLVID